MNSAYSEFFSALTHDIPQKRGIGSSKFYGFLTAENCKHIGIISTFWKLNKKMIKYNLIIDFFVERIYNLYGEIYYDFIKSKYRNFHMH